jgi:hypothetical protein
MVVALFFAATTAWGYGSRLSARCRSLGRDDTESYGAVDRSWIGLDPAIHLPKMDTRIKPACVGFGKAA